MKVIIAGPRDWTDHTAFMDTMRTAHRRFDITEVVSGCCSGVDSMGEAWARERRIPIKPFPADWYPQGPNGPLDKSAGPKRNAAMAEYADALILVWDGRSRGSFSMLKEAAKNKLQIYTNI